MPRPSAKRSTDERAAELRIGRGRVAQCAREEVAENETNADSGGARTNRRKAGADIFRAAMCGIESFSYETPDYFEGRPICCCALYSVARMNCVIQIDAREDGEHISL